MTRQGLSIRRQARCSSAFGGITKSTDGFQSRFVLGAGVICNVIASHDGSDEMLRRLDSQLQRQSKL